MGAGAACTFQHFRSKDLNFTNFSPSLRPPCAACTLHAGFARRAHQVSSVYDGTWIECSLLTGWLRALRRAYILHRVYRILYSYDVFSVYSQKIFGPVMYVDR